MKRLKALAPLVLGLVMCFGYMAYGITKENPVGTVEGVVTMKENGRPLADASIYLDPSEFNGNLPGRSAETDANGHFHIKAVATGKYEIRASSRAHNGNPFKVEVKEGERLKEDVKLDPNAPNLDVAVSQHVFTPSDTPGVHIDGFVPQPDVSVVITRLDADQIAKAGGLNATFEPLNGTSRVDGPEHFGKAVQVIKRPLKKDVEGVFHERFPLTQLAEGIYWVEATAGDLHSGSYINITHMALVTKYSGNNLLTYAVDIKSGAPIAGVSIFTGGAHGLQQVGTSDANGITEAVLKANEKSVVVGKLGDSLAICERQSEDMKEHEGPNTVFLYTDRPIYRPGDLIQFKGIARKLSGMDYSLPKSETVDATFKDSGGNVLGRLKLPMGPHGTFHGSFTTSKEAAPGDFTISTASASGDGSLSVPIAAYRKPDYTITVLGDKPYYVLGEKVKATVACEYYYGGPVVGAKVRVSVLRAEDWLGNLDPSDNDSPDEETDNYQSEEFRGGTYDQSIEAVTDANGRAVIEFPTRADDDPDQVSSDFIYTVEAEVADVGDKTFTGTGSIRVVRGDVRLNVDTDKYVAAPGDTVQVTAKVVDELNPTKPIEGRTVELVAGYEDWYGRKRTFQPIQTYHVVTDANGVAKVSLPVSDKGSIQLQANTVDRAGKKIKAEGFIYVSGASAGDPEREPTMSLMLDRKQYKVGDTAKLLIRTSKPGGSALVSIQAESLISHLVVPITEKSTLMTLPVGVKMSPNAYVSVAYIRDETFMEATKRLTVKRVDRDMQVTVTPDRPTAKPGESVTFDVKTTDAQGHPLSTNASVGVVDEAIFAIQKDMTDIRSAFYPHRSDDVMTSYSFPEIFLDGGDKGTGKISVRSRFLDTAAWVPDVQTGPDGHGKVRVKLPDNLTRWRATAVACSDNATVGMSTNDITARKDLMVTMQTPGYLVSGDRQQLAVTVTNDSGHDVDVALTLQARGIKLDTAPPSSLHVANGKPETIRVDLIAGDAGEAKLTAFGRLPDGSGDALVMPIRVMPHAEPDVQTRSGDTADSATFTFVRSADADAATSRLRLTLNPSLATTLLQPMAALVEFPYGCVEQTMSRFLPSVLVTKTFKDAGLPLPRLSSQLPAITADSFTRIARLQHSDGGWGWWEYDESSPFMTALVLDGLMRAKEAGYAPPESIHTKKALEWANKWINLGQKSRYDSYELNYLAFALARYGMKAEARHALNLAPLDHQGPSEIAYAAMTHALLGDKTDSYLAQLHKMATFKNNRISWSDSPGNSWGEEGTSVVLVAFTTLAPDDPIVPTIVASLMARRRGDTWVSTRDTAYALTGLSKYLAHSHEASSTEQVEVLVGDKVVRQLTLDPKKLDSAQTIDIPISSLPVGDANITLRRAGGTGGRIYYTAELKQQIVRKQFDASSSAPGFSISRKYFVLEPRVLENGTMRLLPSSTPIDRAPTGSIIQCEVTIKSPIDRQFIQVECPTPSNCRVTEREDPLEGEEWSWWWSGTVIRDDRISFFAQTLGKGTQTLTYTMRAESPGFASALPATAINMYDPTEHASSGDNAMEVTR